jgi:hypothetical protein
MKKYFFVLVSFSFLMVQCRKDANNYIKVSGKVLEFGTNKPIANAKVGIYSEGGAFLGTTWSNLVDTTRTDANGFYSIEKQGIDNGSSFYVSAAANKYYTYDPTKYVATGQDVMNNDIVLDPFAWIKVHVKNVNPLNDRDSIFLGNLVGPPSGETIYTGKNVDLNFLNKVRGNLSMRATWTVARNNIGKSFVDTVKIAAHDTLKYEILY